MTVELFFVAGSFVIGVGQIVEARILLRQEGELRGPIAWFSVAEVLWALFCVYLLMSGRLEYSRWLAIMFLSIIPLAIVVSIALDPRLLKGSIPPEAIRVPRPAAYMGVVYGALTAIAALYLLAT